MRVLWDVQSTEVVDLELNGMRAVVEVDMVTASKRLSLDILPIFWRPLFVGLLNVALRCAQVGVVTSWHP